MNVTMQRLRLPHLERACGRPLKQFPVKMADSDRTDRLAFERTPAPDPAQHGRGKRHREQIASKARRQPRAEFWQDRKTLSARAVTAAETEAARPPLRPPEEGIQE